MNNYTFKTMDLNVHLYSKPIQKCCPKCYDVYKDNSMVLEA